MLAALATIPASAPHTACSPRSLSRSFLATGESPLAVFLPPPLFSRPFEYSAVFQLPHVFDRACTRPTSASRSRICRASKRWTAKRHVALVVRPYHSSLEVCTMRKSPCEIPCPARPTITRLIPLNACRCEPISYAGRCSRRRASVGPPACVQAATVAGHVAVVATARRCPALSAWS